MCPADIVCVPCSQISLIILSFMLSINVRNLPVIVFLTRTCIQIAAFVVMQMRIYSAFEKVEQAISQLFCALTAPFAIIPNLNRFTFNKENNLYHSSKSRHRYSLFVFKSCMLYKLGIMDLRNEMKACNYYSISYIRHVTNIDQGNANDSFHIDR